LDSFADDDSGIDPAGLDDREGKGILGEPLRDSLLMGSANQPARRFRVSGLPHRQFLVGERLEIFFCHRRRVLKLQVLLHKGEQRDRSTGQCPPLVAD